MYVLKMYLVCCAYTRTWLIQIFFGLWMELIILPDFSANKRGARRRSEWEILEGLKDGQRFDKKPDIYTGYLHKKRKWPLKGWHKVS
jgi:uncharacterized membrane protein